MKNSIISILTSILGKGKESGSNASFCCPNKDHPDHKGGDIDYRLSFFNNLNNFNCWVCGYKGFTQNLIKEYGNSIQLSDFRLYSKFTEKQEKKSSPFYLPKAYKEISEECPDFLADRLKHRNISMECAEFYRIGSMYGYPILPSIGKNGNVEFYTKDNVGGFPKYLFPKDVAKEEYIMNIGNIIPDVPLIVFEGFYNAISLYPYTNVTWLNGKVFHKKFKEYVFSNRIPVFLFLDNELKSNENCLEFMQECLDRGIYCKMIGEYEYKDPNDYLKKGKIDLLQNILKNELNLWQQYQQENQW